MDKHRTCLRTSEVLLLTFLSAQIPNIAMAAPHLQRGVRTVALTTDHCDHSSTGANQKVIATAIAQEIKDGQVQVPVVTYTSESTLTSGLETIVSTTTVTETWSLRSDRNEAPTWYETEDSSWAWPTRSDEWPWVTRSHWSEPTATSQSAEAATYSSSSTATGTVGHSESSSVLVTSLTATPSAVASSSSTAPSVQSSSTSSVSIEATSSATTMISSSTSRIVPVSTSTSVVSASSSSTISDEAVSTSTIPASSTTTTTTSVTPVSTSTTVVPASSMSTASIAPVSTSTTVVPASSTSTTSFPPVSTSTSVAIASSSSTRSVSSVSTSTTANPSISSGVSAATSTLQSSVSSVPRSFTTRASSTAIVSSVTSTASTQSASSMTLSTTMSAESTTQSSVSLSITLARTSISLVDTSTLPSGPATMAAVSQSIFASDVFQAIATDAPPSQLPIRSDHPVPRLGIQPQSQRLETNKFYANFFLGTQSSPTWTHPYSVAWSKGVGETNSWGLYVSHVERSQLAGAGSKESFDAGEWGYFVNPTGLQSIVFSAAELSSSTVLTTDTIEAFSVNVNLAPESGGSPIITFPLVQGMAFVTAVYHSGTPTIQSGLGIAKMTYVGIVSGTSTYKYRVELLDGNTWLIYVNPEQAQFNADTFILSSGNIQGPVGFVGYIQVAKVPLGSTTAESVYDDAAGVYPTAAAVAGSVGGTSGSYSLSWTKAGNTIKTLLMFALPHHIDTLSSQTAGAVTGVQLETTTKGMATAISADTWSFVLPDLPIDMSFTPWTPDRGNIQVVDAAAQEAIASAGYFELLQNITAQTNVGSLYYDGKALAKFATICVTLYEVAGNKTLALTGLELLKSTFATHVNNEMEFPLVYDDAWGGTVSIATYEDGDLGADFGNTVYNDHHFHYGYFVYAAAVIGYLDQDWLSEGTNKAWVNMLVRDYGNSITTDPYYPFSRMFDWYHGHSWAHGLIETGDGKDQESSSEDTMSLYAIKMWGQVIGDNSMEARGNLMLGIQARSLQHYYLYLNSNTVEPAVFIGNKVAGILFENKIDHTTYFGSLPEYIEGIHMLPLMPCSSLTRTPDFVQQEWNSYFSDSGIRPASEVTGGWKGIIMANYALIDAQASYDFMTDIPLDELDGGASQTWYLAWAAALGGQPTTNQRREAAPRAGTVEPEHQLISGEVSGKVSRRHHGDAYKLRSDGVGVPGHDVDLPSDSTSRLMNYMKPSPMRSDDGIAHEETDAKNITIREPERSSRLRQRMSGAQGRRRMMS